MTDLTRLGELPELRPLPGQVETALVQVRKRRLRSALTTLTSTAAAVVAATVLMTHPGGPHSLEPADSPLPRTATAVPTPTGHGGEAHRASGPRFATASPEASATGPVDGPTRVAGPPGQADAAPRPRPDVVRYDYSSYTNPNRTVDGRHYTQPCGPGVGVPASPSGGGCHGALARDEGAAGTTLFETMCLSTGNAATTTLHFATEQEAEFVVYSDVHRTRELWRSSRGMTYERRPHDVVYESGDCSEWSVLFDRKDESGRALAPGRYWFAVTVTADEPLLNGSYFTIS